jgi:hypothetical protein
MNDEILFSDMNFSKNFACEHGTIDSFVFTKYEKVFTRNQFVDGSMEGDEESSHLEIGNNPKISKCNFVQLKISVQKETTSFFKGIGISRSITLNFENLIFIKCESEFFYRGNGFKTLQINSVFYIIMVFIIN